MKVDPNQAEATIEEAIRDILNTTYSGADLPQAWQAARISQLYLIKALLVATGYDELLVARVRDLWKSNICSLKEDEVSHLLSTNMDIDNIWPFLGMQSL
ncbi:hypothetical protein HY772_10240 [Candidatus Woesearchaeota archaeon]|nr:hypothetical protein [Candidatus Woesearchaeota archaeon]